MKIEILCGGGSPDGVHLSDIYGQHGRVGVGGAELALLTLCEGWSKAGHQVILYNNPKRQDGVFEQRMVSDFERENHNDVVIFFREPTQKVLNVKCKKVFWSCDQYTVGDFSHFAKFVDKVVTISPFHTKYFEDRYGIINSIPIDIPVRTWEYEKKIEKIKNRLIFTSVPDRGLQQVAETFPRIKERVPDVSLVITSDYRLWGAANPMNGQFVQMFLRMGDVQFLGAVPRARLIEEQLKAEIHYYPCVYEELFCIAVAESQVAGAFPITTNTGALRTTNMGVIFDGDAKSPQTQKEFVEAAVDYLKNPIQLRVQQEYVKEKAVERFSIENVMRSWDYEVFNG